MTQTRFSKATVILNPKAAGSRTLRSSAPILEELRTCADSLDLVRTRDKGDGIVLARKAVELGSDLVVAVGGDGTVNEVVNGMFMGVRRTERQCVLGILPAGSSSSLAKELGIPQGADAVKLITHGTMRAIDLILLQWLTPQCERKERLAASMAHFGFGGAVARLVGPWIKKAGGFLAFAVAATVELVRHKSRLMSVEIDGTEIAQSRLLCAIVASSRWEGGGMCVAPQAIPDDGLLDVVVVKDLPVSSRLRCFPKVYKGTHLDLPEVTSARGRIVSIKSGHVIPFEFDGESAECRKCRIEVIPRALKVLVPK